MKPKYIICENKAERDAVLKKLEERGYVWISGGEKPTKWNYNGWKDDEAIYFNISHGSGTISWGSASSDFFSDEPEKLKITAQKFLSNDRPILITRKGCVVTAEDKNTGEKAIATCSPDDTFDFGTGAIIAVARLVAKDGVISGDAETVLRKMLGDDANSDAPAKRVYTDDDRNFTVCDRVVVRDWNDMAKEYNVKDGCISPDWCSTGFTTQMKHLCGRTATVTSVDGNYVRVKFDDESGDTNWYLRRWMLNPTYSDKSTTKFNVGDLVTLKNGIEPGKTYGGMTLYHGSMFDSLNGKPEKVKGVWKRTKNSPSYQTESEWYYSEEMLEKWDEDKIREGDKVHVKEGCTKDRYDTYYKWLKDYISDVDLLLGFERIESVSTADVYTVVKIAPHEHFTDCQLAFVKRTDGLGNTYSYLFDISALEKVTK